MADAAVIDTGGGGGGGPLAFVADHPILAAAGVGAVIGLVVLIRRSTSGSVSAAAPSGGQLSPSANIALGQVAYDVTQGFGQASIAAAQNAAQTQAGIDSITELLNSLGTDVEGVRYDISSTRAQIQNNQAETDRNLVFIGSGGTFSPPIDYYGPFLHAGDYLHDSPGANQYAGGAVASPNSLAASPAMPALASAA